MDQQPFHGGDEGSNPSGDVGSKRPERAPRNGCVSATVYRGGPVPQSEATRLASVRARFETRYAVDPDAGRNAHLGLDACWLWTGRRLKLGGYGVLKSSGRNLRAHVVSYELHHGPVPAGLGVLHRCGNAPCVNPGHLYAGTPLQNARDAALHGVVPGARLTADDVIAVKRRLAAGESRKAIAADLGVRYALIGRIARGEKWGWLDV